MFPWMTVGMPVPSSFSHVFCVRRMGDCRKTEHTNLALMILNAPWSSSVPLKSLTCQLRGLWRTLGWWSCMSHLQHPASTWLLPRIWWAGSLFSHCFWLVTLLRLSLTCSARTRQQASHLAEPTQLLWTDEGSAISTKLTSGCGGLGAARPALGACRSIRLRRGRMLSAMRCTSVQPRQNGLARRLDPDSK